MAIRKRQLVLAALVVALGAAVYLNWQFGGNSQIVDAGTSVSDKELGAAQLVNGSVDSTPSSAVSELCQVPFQEGLRQRLLQKQQIQERIQI